MALAATEGEKTLEELAQQYDAHPNQVIDWTGMLATAAKDLFGAGRPHRARATLGSDSVYCLYMSMLLGGTPAPVRSAPSSLISYHPQMGGWFIDSGQ
jgi:hypothetical protein